MKEQIGATIGNMLQDLINTLISMFIFAINLKDQSNNIKGQLTILKKPRKCQDW